jgi:hypothetical protein
LRPIYRRRVMSEPDEQPGTPADDELGIEKQPVETDDLPVEEKEAEDVQGGFAPPYVPAGPVVQG